MLWRHDSNQWTFKNGAFFDGFADIGGIKGIFVDGAADIGDDTDITGAADNTVDNLLGLIDVIDFQRFIG